MGLFKRRLLPKRLPKELLSLKTKRINYVYEDFGEFLSSQKADCKAFLHLTPVNYYAVKDSYIEGQYFYSTDYKECYVLFRHYENDKSVGESEIFTITTEDTIKAFAKVGIIVKPTEGE